MHKHLEVPDNFLTPDICNSMSKIYLGFGNKTKTNLWKKYGNQYNAMVEGI